jgi:hypothetical protein
MDVFQYQFQNNKFYYKYCSILGKDKSKITNTTEIPFLPIQFFKNYMIRTGSWKPAATFTSSGTTGAINSKHLLRSKKFYRQIAQTGFEHFYGPIEDYCVLGLLPSYLERSGSSLIFMVDDFIKKSKYPQSGFFLYDTQKLLTTINKNKTQNIPTLLIGVSFALLDLAESNPSDLANTIIMETGGMKGRREEITRAALHQKLGTAFQTPLIHSEYGMTELSSQAYSKGNGLFYPSPTMQILVRDITDPLTIHQKNGRTGALNIIDLANLHTTSFIATDDLGRKFADQSFEILGRLDNSDMRGCNLLVIES